MEKIIVITADLGHFKAYRIVKDPLEISPRIQLIESYDSIDGHGRLGEKLSDAAGRFKRGGSKGDAAMGSGERHTIKGETEKRLITMMAKDINSLITREKCRKWYLASGVKINRRILENLTPEIKARLDKNIKADLTKTDKSEILDHFI